MMLMFMLILTGAMMSADMEVSITGCSVGKMHEVLWCHVKNLSEPVALHVNFEVKVSNSNAT